jgi:hypothetical protein
MIHFMLHTRDVRLSVCRLQWAKRFRVGLQNFNKTGNVRTNITLRCVRLQNRYCCINHQLLHILSVFLYTELFSMQSTCTILYLWLFWLYSILTHYFIYGTIFGKKLLNIKCVFWFSLQTLCIPSCYVNHQINYIYPVKYNTGLFKFE